MFDGIINAITDFVRLLLWSIPALFLWLLDFLWEVVLRIATLNISGVDAISNWYILISTTVFLFVIYKIVKIATKFFLDEDYQEKIKISKIIINLSLCSVLITLIPIGYSYVCNVSSLFIENTATFIPGNAEDMSMSNVLIQAGRIDVESIDSDLSSPIDRYDEAFHINAKDDDGNYKYFPTFSSIFLMWVISIMASFIFLMVGLQIGQRMAMLGLKYLFAPKAVASIIDPEDNMFGVWMQLITGDLIMNFAQIYGTYFIIFLCNNANIQTLLGDDVVGLFASILFFIGGLLGVQEIPTTVAHLTGGSGKGAMQSLQDLKATTAVATGMAGAGGAAIGGGLALAGNGFSIGNGAFQEAGGGMRGLGAAAGALGKAPFQAMGNKIKTGGTGQDTSNGGAVGTMDSRNTGTSNNGNEKSTKTYDEKPTEKQINAATKLGIESPQNMSRGDLSVAMQEAGAEPSFWEGTDKAKSYHQSNANGLDDNQSKSIASTTNKKPQNDMSNGFTHMYQQNANRKKNK
jgi:hypothetical protein